MMKLQNILVYLLLVATVVLYVLYLTEKKTESVAVQSTDTLSNRGEHKIAFVNVDTLLKQYQFYDELEKKLLERQKGMEIELNRKMAAFEKEAQEFQRKVQLNSFLSEESARRQQQELIMKEQNLYKLREDLTVQLAKESQELEKQLLDTVTNFLKEFNANHTYDYILNKAAMLYGNDALDITDTLVYLLNKRYEASKARKK